MAIVENAVVLAIGLLELVQRLGDQEGAHAVAGHEGQAGLEEVEPSERRKLVEHHEELMLGRPARLFGVELFGESAADLVEAQADQRLGPADVGGRDDKIERNRMLRLDEIGDAPVAARVDRKRPRLNSSHYCAHRTPTSA